MKNYELRITNYELNHNILILKKITHFSSLRVVFKVYYTYEVTQQLPL